MFFPLDADARARILTDNALYAAVLTSINATTSVDLNISSNPGSTPSVGPAPALANLASCMAWTTFSADHLPLSACLATSLMIASSMSPAEPRATAVLLGKSPVAALSKSHWGSRLRAMPSLTSLPLSVTFWRRNCSMDMPVSRNSLPASMAVPLSSLMFCRAATTRASAAVGASTNRTFMNWAPDRRARSYRLWPLAM